MRVREFSRIAYSLVSVLLTKSGQISYTAFMRNSEDLASRCNRLWRVNQVTIVAPNRAMWYYDNVRIRPIKIERVLTPSLSLCALTPEQKNTGNLRNTGKLIELTKSLMSSRANTYSGFRWEKHKFSYKGKIYTLDKIKTNYSSFFVYFGLVEFRNGKPFVNKTLDDLGYKDIILDTDKNAQLVVGCWKGKKTLHVINHHEFKFLWTFFKRDQHKEKQEYFAQHSMKFYRPEKLADYLLSIRTESNESRLARESYSAVRGSTDKKVRTALGIM